MKRFILKEISIVDRPAQDGATARIFKRRHEPMSHYDPPHIARLHKARERPVDEMLLDLEDEEQEFAMADEDWEEGDELEMADDGVEDESEDDELALAGADTDEEVEDDEPLDEELKAINSELSYDENDDPDGEDAHPLVQRVARGLRKNNRGLSTRLARLMACGRLMAASGAYQKRYITKSSSNISTSSSRPFHQPRGEERRAEMDRRARVHRHQLDQLIAEMRATNPRMSNCAALHKLRDLRPGLFR